jgi:hypothetical protein
VTGGHAKAASVCIATSVLMLIWMINLGYALNAAIQKSGLSISWVNASVERLWIDENMFA